ncbi:MAG: (Fe-S)-binding protein, partial [Syntrophobacterales bacterium]
MSELNTVMDIFKLLDKSNCRKCDLPTCLAFAAAVFKGEKQLADCPSLESEIIERYGGKAGSTMTL